MSSRNNAAVLSLEKKGKKLEEGLKRGLHQGLDAFHALFVDKRLTGRPGLKVRTGNLRRSFHHNIRGNTLSTIVGRYGTDVPYAAKHEEGGKITPTNKKFLTIPLEDNLTPAGVMRMDAPTVINSFPYHAFIPTKNPPNLLLVAGESKETAKPFFVLVKSVKIPPRLELFKTWRKFSKDENGLKHYLRIGVQDALKR